MESKFVIFMLCGFVAEITMANSHSQATVRMFM